MGDLAGRIKQMQGKEIRLGIGIPNNFPMIPSAFFDSFIMMEKPPFVFIRSSSTHDLAGLRNQIVKQALEMDCTHLIMMDTDQVYQADTIPRLLSHDKDIVGCLVCRRYPPFDPLMLQGDIGRYQTIKDWAEGDLVEVDATGTGCLLFKMGVFRNIPAPWFFFRGTEEDPVGEDIGFCSDARKSGYKIYVDTGCQAGHLAHHMVTLDTNKLFSCLDAAKARFESEHDVGQVKATV